jgi:hypothetical protein
MKAIVYRAKRRIMQIGCLFGHHKFKMGVSAKGGGGGGCLWCRKPSSQKSVETDMLMIDAQRYVRFLFGGKL